jgi:predicted nucleic acid-binding protein
MNRIIFDSSALLAYFLDAPGAAGIVEWLNRLTTETDLQACMTTLAAGELFYTAMRHKNEATAERAHRMLLGLPIALLVPDMELSLEAAKLKAVHPISFVDAHTAALVVKQQGLLVAADKVFDVLHGLPFFSVQYL